MNLRKHVLFIISESIMKYLKPNGILMLINYITIYCILYAIFLFFILHTNKLNIIDTLNNLQQLKCNKNLL